MDFGIGFLSNNLMLPILDFFYGIVPSYGLAIVALTLVVRFALYPLNAGSIRNMRRMKVTQPLMKERVDQIQQQHKDDPVKQREEMSRVYKELGNPLAGCFPLLIQMPILFALFATLRGSPFSDVNYSVDVQIFPQEQIEQVQPQAYATKAQNYYFADGIHASVVAMIPGGNRLGVNEKVQVELQTVDGKPLKSELDKYPEVNLVPTWTIIKGQDKIQVGENGQILALAPGDATIQVGLRGLASDKGFLFIDALGRVGAVDPDGKIHWDIVGMILAFGVSLYLNQVLSGQGASGNSQQDTVNKITPVIFSGMFFFFPLPAGVLLYMLIANIFQTVQAFILSREPLPEHLQKIVEESSKTAKLATVEGEREALPFEPGRSKKKAQ
ncbi:MAG TPA: membrane protein insertase YidC [Planktothrix sp. UBA8407]|jgi:membrane protein insertase, YidC/Oxa1 family, C-terminal domain|nr:membrane protein insertase YidC [Planktothrix sp. UBA8402]HAO10769.1 membrane protein insertase YidC [Planktothrix sp. UBA8407]HBK21527.1 membrane protein insertase YidC [Planktothrix sp. UBA10369]